MLGNRKYLGEVEHQGEVFEGEHEAIVPRRLWGQARSILDGSSAAVRGNRTRAKTPALLKGVLRCASCDRAMGPTFTKKRGKTYRYYLCTRAGKEGYGECPIRTVPAGEIEDAVMDQLRAVFCSPELIAKTYAEAPWERGLPARIRSPEGEGASDRHSPGRHTVRICCMELRRLTRIEEGHRGHHSAGRRNRPVDG